MTAIVITMAGYVFIQAQDGHQPRTTPDGKPIFAVPGGRFATQDAIATHIEKQRGYRPRAIVKPR